MPSLLEVARHEVGRLQAICRKLSEIKLPVIKDEVDELQVIVARMERELRDDRQKLDRHGPDAA